jgi:hypothetical protein
MIGNGALAGSLSPFSPTGVVANGVMARMGFPGLEWQTFFNNILGHTLVSPQIARQRRTRARKCGSDGR